MFERMGGGDEERGGEERRDKNVKWMKSNREKIERNRGSARMRL